MIIQRLLTPVGDAATDGVSDAMNDFTKAFEFVFHRIEDRPGHFIGGWSFVSQRMIEHLEISAKSILISILIGVPLGIFLGHIHRFSFLAINVSNLGRALPSLAILAIFLPITGIGQTTAIIALVVLAAPPILTNAYVAVDGVDPDTVDAAKGIGLTPMQILLKVELPLALPLIFAGIRTAAVFVIATATLTGYFGGGGLGDIISNSASYHLYGVIGASYVLIVLAVLAQILFVVIEEAITPAGLRRRKFLPTFLTPTKGADTEAAAVRRIRRPARARHRHGAREPHQMNSFRQLGRRTFAGCAAAALAACGSSGGDGARAAPAAGAATGGGSTDLPGKGKPAVTMGDKDFAEQFLLGELYAQALTRQGLHDQPEGEHRLVRGHRQGADQRQDPDVPRVHRRHLLRPREPR